MDKLMIRVRDWWRGFNNEDLASALRKIEKGGAKPGAIIPLTRAEYEAWMARNRQS